MVIKTGILIDKDIILYKNILVLKFSLKLIFLKKINAIMIKISITSVSFTLIFK